ncbi:MAG: flagellar hook-basal body complex protein FliE [Pseudomonadota bacterium]
MAIDPTLASSAYASARQVQNGTKGEATNSSESQGAQKQGGAEFAQAAKNVANAVAESEKAASAMIVGEADPHSVIEALAVAELAVETAVTVRDKVVEAYQEILRMPI